MVEKKRKLYKVLNNVPTNQLEIVVNAWAARDYHIIHIAPEIIDEDTAILWVIVLEYRSGATSEGKPEAAGFFF